jgi:hypothetical protein
MPRRDIHPLLEKALAYNLCHMARTRLKRDEAAPSALAA